MLPHTYFQWVAWVGVAGWSAVLARHRVRGRQRHANLRRCFAAFYFARPLCAEYNLTRAAITILVGFAFGTMFWRLGDNRCPFSNVKTRQPVSCLCLWRAPTAQCRSVAHCSSVPMPLLPLLARRQSVAGVLNIMGACEGWARTALCSPGSVQHIWQAHLAGSARGFRACSTSVTLVAPLAPSLPSFRVPDT